MIAEYSSMLFQRSDSVSGSPLAGLCLISRIKINRGFASSHYLIFDVLDAAVQ